MSELADELELLMKTADQNGWSGGPVVKLVERLPAILQALRDGEKTLSAPPVTVEEVARVIDPDAWADPFSTRPIFEIAKQRQAALDRAQAVLALFQEPSA